MKKYLLLSTLTLVFAKVSMAQTDAINIVPSGNVGIGTTAAAAFKLQVAGDAGPNADLTYNLGSASLRWNNLYVNSILGPGALWTRSSPYLYNTTLTDNVGIGIATPGQKLTIIRTAGAGSVADILTGDGTQWMQINSNSSAGSWSPMAQANDHTIYYSNGTVETGGLFIGQWSASAKGIRIATDGNVGIGVATPTASKLQVAGFVSGSDGTSFATKWSGDNHHGIWYRAAVSADGATVSAADAITFREYGSASLGYHFWTGGTTMTERFRITNGYTAFLTGNVGIATATTNNRMEFMSDNSSQALQFNTSSYVATDRWGTRIYKSDIGGGIPLKFQTQSDATWYNGIDLDHGQDNAHPSLKSYYNTQLATAGGNVGIGNIAPAYKLDVSGNLNVTGGARFSGTIYSNWTANARIMANADNAAGGGIAVSDDGGFFDYNDNYITYNGTTGYGLRIAGNSGVASAGRLSIVGLGTGIVKSTGDVLGLATGADLPSGSGNYIQNQYVSAQTASLWISGQAQVQGTSRFRSDIGVDAGASIYFGREESFGGSDVGGADYGFIRWDNDNDTYAHWGNSTENGALIIGSQNDGANTVSDVVVMNGVAANIFNPVSGINYFTGNVGIGTFNPGARLHLSGGVPTGLGTLPSNTLGIIENGSSDNYLTFRNTADNGTYAGFQFLDNNVGGYIAFKNFGSGNSDAMIYGAYQDHVFQNGTSSTVDARPETMRIKQNGTVGIGTSNPQQRLQLSNSSYLGLMANGGAFVPTSWNRGNAGGIIFASSAASDGTGWAYGSRMINHDYGDGLALSFDVLNNTTWTNDALVVSGRNGSIGNVGIGVNNPLAKLHIAGAYPVLAGNDGMLKIKSVTGGSCPGCGTEAVSLQTSIDNRADDYTISGYGGNDRHVLSLQPQGGYVGIGTTTPGYKLDVIGNTRVSNNFFVSTDNTTGNGIYLADDGSIVDNNDGYATHRFSYGLAITDGLNTNTQRILLKNTGDIQMIENNANLVYQNSYETNDEWRLVYVDNFEADAEGWKAQTMGATGDNGLTRETTGIIGLSYWIRPTNGNDRVLKKSYNMTGITYSEVKVEFTYYFLDSWDNENAWFGAGTTESFGSGSWATPEWNMRWEHDWGDPRPGTNVSFWGNTGWSDAVKSGVAIFKNSFGNTMWLFAGSSLDSGTGDETFAIDNIKVYVR